MVTSSPLAKPDTTGQIPVDAPPEERMHALIDTISAYIEYYHGGFVELVSFDGKLVKVRMGGACENCQLSSSTLQGWVEGTVRQFFPDIEKIEAV
ncbi:MAG: NifU family protein [Chloroflexi bacterium]|nr:NifU family protein [Chloroflexota bacterium]